MKVEYIFSARPETERWPRVRRELVFYYTGETVGPGIYACTFCGHQAHVASSRPLTTCQACDSTEFSLLATAA